MTAWSVTLIHQITVEIFQSRAMTNLNALLFITLGTKLVRILHDDWDMLTWWRSDWHPSPYMCCVCSSVLDTNVKIHSRKDDRWMAWEWDICLYSIYSEAGLLHCLLRMLSLELLLSTSQEIHRQFPLFRSFYVILTLLKQADTNAGAEELTA